MFLVYGGEKELIVNGYIDSSFDTDPDDSKTLIHRKWVLESLQCNLDY